MIEEVINIFNGLQICDRSQFKTNITTLKSIKKNKKDFNDDLLDILAIFLLNAKKTDLNAFVLFMNCFFEELGAKDKKLMKCFYEFLFQALSSENKNVRRNSLSLLRLLELNIEAGESLILAACTMLFDKDNDVTKEAIKFLADHQEFEFNGKDRVHTIFMDLIRHNPHPSVRREALKFIKINDKTLNCVIEKVSDSDFSVRRVFYEDVFDNLLLKQVKVENLEFLIDRVMIEREFDYKKELVDKLIDEFDLEKNLYTFLEQHQFDNLKPLLNALFSQLEFEVVQYPKSYVEAIVLNLHTDYVEATLGLDEIKLAELKTYITHLNNLIEEGILFENEFLSYCVNVINYYDLFKNDERMLVTNLLNNIVRWCRTDGEYDSIFRIYKKIMVNGEFVFNLMEDKSKVILISKYFLKHFKEDVIVCDRLINDILLNLKDVNRVCECLLYYIEYHKDSRFDNYFLNNGSLSELVDYYLIKKGKDILSRIIEHLDPKIEEEDHSVIIPLSKLIISECITDIKYLAFMLKMFYSDLSDDLKQYCMVFVNELFKRNTTLLLDSFPVAFKAVSDKRLFLNHTLCWIKTNNDKGKEQTLFYRTVCFLMREDLSKQDIAILANLLEQIDITTGWEPRTLKKIIYCCSAILKKIDNKGNMNNIIGRLLLIDDGEPINQLTLSEVKKDMS